MILRTDVKINLGLNVLRKRPDGFHDLETLFIPCKEYGDTLEVITADDYSRTCASISARYKASSIAQGISDDGKTMITIARSQGVDWDPVKDLCVKACKALRADFDLPPVKIFLEKGAPVGAGLGGGSSDAAFTLKALNEIFGLGLGEDKLCEYAATLGSDTSFFIYDRPMFGSGRGEILEPFDPGLEEQGLQIRLVVPEGISVSTAQAYSGISPALAAIPLREVLSRPIEQWKDLLVNDFEASVFKEHPELEAIKQSLYESGAVYASMSGSGSALFGIYR